MSENWLVIGICGVTCGGKTTLANKLKTHLHNCRMICQDDYFLDENDERHTWIPELNHINFDILSSLDMEKMHADIVSILKQQSKTAPKNGKSNKPILAESTTAELLKIINKQIDHINLNILIVEGFCIFNYKPIQQLFNLKYYVTLNKEECYKRRIKRVYDPPDCPGYFEECAWPEYINFLQDVKKNMRNVTYFSEFTEDPFKEILNDLVEYL